MPIDVDGGLISCGGNGFGVMLLVYRQCCQPGDRLGNHQDSHRARQPRHDAYLARVLFASRPADRVAGRRIAGARPPVLIAEASSGKQLERFDVRRAQDPEVSVVERRKLALTQALDERQHAGIDHSH